MYGSVSAPFCSGAFDVVYCRNTLHHLSLVAEIRSLLERLQRWSRNMVIIAEVLDPRGSMNPWDWLRDQYYRRFLGHVGDALLSSSQLEGLFADAFLQQDWKYTFEVYNTIGGRISLCIARRREAEQPSTVLPDLSAPGI
jgi:hypothetical protein